MFSIQHSHTLWFIVHCGTRRKKGDIFFFIILLFGFLFFFGYISFLSISVSLPFILVFNIIYIFWCIWHHKNENINQLTFNHFSSVHSVSVWISSKSPSLCAFIKIIYFSFSSLFLVLLMFPKQKKNQIKRKKTFAFHASTRCLTSLRPFGTLLFVTDENFETNKKNIMKKQKKKKKTKNLQTFIKSRLSLFFFFF